MYTPLFFIILVLYYKIPFPICGSSFICSTQPSLAWLPVMFPPRNLLPEAEVRECWVQGQQPEEGNGLSISHSLEPSHICPCVSQSQHSKYSWKLFLLSLLLPLHQCSHWMKIRKRNTVFSQWQTTITAWVFNAFPPHSPPPAWLATKATPQSSYLFDLRGCPEGQGLNTPKPPNYSLLNSLSARLADTKQLSWITRYTSHFQTSSLPKSSHLDEWSNL